MEIITENQLDVWVQGHAHNAQGVIVELVWRLLAASCPNPRERRFPLGDSIGQPGPDGFLHTDSEVRPFVPEGKSFWQIGTGIRAGDKATKDYRDLTRAIPEDVRLTSTFVFVTPLSGRRDWQYTWKPGSQARWLRERRRRNDWRDVRVIDGSGLIDWLHHWPAVELWLAKLMGLASHQLQTLEQRWMELRTIGEPPLLTPQVFLANRDSACEKLREIFSWAILQLKLDTRFPNQVADFIAAFVATLDDDTKVDAFGRSIIITGVEGWNVITTLQAPHVLIADFDIDEADSLGTRLLERARKSGHAVIYGGLPGGIPHPHRVSLTEPTDYQIRGALEMAGYNRERARTLAQRSNGNLNSLLRCLQHLSLMPEWAQGTEAAELVIAEFLGGWSEASEADRLIAEKLSKKAYGEWIGRIREVALAPGTPLIQRDGKWKFVLRYEGWHALGQRIFDEHLDDLRAAAAMVLRERDPQFELSPDKRYAASIYGKELIHSHSLRNGIAESLALLGSHPKALISCSLGKPEATAALSVREILADADWVLWASLNNQIPLLAEAAPEEFLDAVEKALNINPCPLDSLFAQERGGLTGRSYMTGLLWALETLAWDAQYLTRVVVILGELAARDPGGQWGNRPDNSLLTILLPWFPQTCAPNANRKAAVEALIREFPDVAWRLLLSLLPQVHQTTSGTRKPRWREMIPDDWSQGATLGEEMEQYAVYADLAISMVKNDLSKLTDLIGRLAHLPLPAFEQILAHLSSESIISLPQADRLRLWTELVSLITKHRRFADAKWAMSSELVDKITIVAERLAPESPAFRHQRLFSVRDFDLYEEKGGYEEQRNELEKRREDAVIEIVETEGMQALMEFVKAVESPSRVGFAFGMVAESDMGILPDLLLAENSSLAQFAGGFVWGRFRSKGWQWIDSIEFSQWTPLQLAQFLTYLPFNAETWRRSARLLGENDSLYWTKAIVNPHQAEKDMESAIDLLIKNDRPYAAIGCLNYLQHDKKPFNSQQAVTALRAALQSSEGIRSIDTYALVEVIKALQDDRGVNPDDIFEIEWAYLQVLDQHQDAYPKLLERRLSDAPEFFCEAIRLVFLSKSEERPIEEPTKEQKFCATNAYQLLHHWRTPPGIQQDWTYNGENLNAWLEHVKASCTESGHLEIALLTVGKVLIHVPADPDGLWIHHCAAEALNARDAEVMREGFTNALYNSRGAHVFTAGQEERQIAERYRRQADEVEVRGYHRFAASLRKLASGYDHEAERGATRDPFDL